MITLRDLASQQGWEVGFDQTSQMANITNPLTGKGLSFQSGGGFEYGLGGLQDGSNMVANQQSLIQQLNPSFQPQQYTSPYQDQIKEALSGLGNKKFEYNPMKDQSYQAFLQQQQRLGQEAFNNSLGGLSAATGGRPNTWSSAVASQQQQAYALRGAEAMGQFEQMAYGRWQDEYNRELNMINLLMDMDDTEFNRFKYSQEQDWKVYETEYREKQDAIDKQRQAIRDALERTDITGYVSNKDAAILGLAAGTPSRDARIRSEEMEDYLTKLEKEEEQWKRQQDYMKEIDKEMIKAREQSQIRVANATRTSSGGGGRTTGTTGSTDSTTRTKPITELSASDNTYYRNQRKSILEETSGDNWNYLGRDQKKAKFLEIERRILTDASMHESIKEELLRELESHKDFKYAVEGVDFSNAPGFLQNAAGFQKR